MFEPIRGTGPSGLPTCWTCGVEVTWKGKHFCSKDCEKTFEDLTNPLIHRKSILKRDKGICCLCGFDTEALRASVRRVSPEMRSDVLRSLGFPDSGSLWMCDFDGDIPAEGPAFAVNRLKTYCYKCHKGLQMADRARKVKEKREKQEEKRRKSQKLNPVAANR